MVTTIQRAPMTERGTTSSLIASDRVEGTAVYDAHGKRIGKVERLVIDKASGRIAYGAFSASARTIIRFPGRWWTTMRNSADTVWTLPKSNSRTLRKSNKGKAGSKRTGTATRRSMVIGSNPHRCKSAKLHP